MKKRIYLAGAISGVENYKEIFEKQRNELKNFFPENEYQIICPHDFVPSTADWHTAVDSCLNVLEQCDYIYLLDNWKTSRGARLEKRYAEKYNITILNDILKTVDQYA